jgi:YfiH family protein
MAMITDDPQALQADFYWRDRDGVRALVCAPLEQDGFTNGFSTRLGGVSPFPPHPGDALNLAGFNEDTVENILENRRRFLKLFAGQWTLTGCWQVHGADVRLVRNELEAQPAPDVVGDGVYCDALVSDAARVLIGVKTADCVPILIGDASTGAFAAVHAGWRGTVAGIVTEALQQLDREYATRPADVRVAIGPAAASCCYEVGAEVISAFAERFPESDKLFAPTRAGHARIDLFQANQDQLVSAGVSADRIHSSGLCTMCRTDLFFSYRCEKKIQGKVGRLMAVIGRRPVRYAALHKKS